jgi:hypothetical protein
VLYCYLVGAKPTQALQHVSCYGRRRVEDGVADDETQLDDDRIVVVAVLV